MGLAVVVRLGGPLDMVERAYDSFDAPPPNLQGTDLGERLFSFCGSYRVDLWESAWHQYEANPLLGGGAGSYEQHWLADRPFEHKVRDAHSLYLETLSELGPVGLVLLLLALGAPLAAAVLARGHPLVPAAVAAYVAYLVHAGIDWDWELPALTLAALICGAAMLAAARSEERTLVLGAWGRGAMLAAALAVAARRVRHARRQHRRRVERLGGGGRRLGEAASEARKAKRWAPWSSEPWQRLGEAHLGQGAFAEAEHDFREAIEREPRDFELWLDLARATDGAERAAALARARELNPVQPGDRGVQRRLGAQRDGPRPARRSRPADPARVRVRRVPDRRRRRGRGRHERDLRARAALPRQLRPQARRAGRVADRHRATLHRGRAAAAGALGASPTISADTLDVEAETVDRVTLDQAVERLEERDRELIALRYGSDLSARQIGELLELTTNAVEVALHRALARLRKLLEGAGRAAGRGAASPTSEHPVRKPPPRRY